MGTLGKTLSPRSKFRDPAFLGRRYGTRVVVEIKRPAEQPMIYWLMRCDCGDETWVAAANIETQRKARACRRCSAAVRPGDQSHGWRGCGPVTATAFGHWRQGARVRGIEFEVTIEEVAALHVEQRGLCAVSGRPLIYKRGNCKPGATASLDRKISSLGYTRGNIQLVTKEVNFAKQEMTNAELIALARDIVSFADR